MHYNLKIDIERTNKTYVAQLEISSAGRARRGRVVADTFEDILAAVKSEHDAKLAELDEYHKASVPAAPPPPPAPVPKTKAEVKAEKEAAKAAAKAGSQDAKAADAPAPEPQAESSAKAKPAPKARKKREFAAPK